MTIPAPRFNAMNDAWLPLIQSDGTMVWASPVEILCGEKDGVDLDYPRDDFRIYALLLLSALVQALFPAKTKRELLQRIDEALRRADVERRVKPVLTDFDLFGPTPFLQITPPVNPPKDGGAAPFVFPGDDRSRPEDSRAIDAISLPIALVMLFAEQTYAGGAGRGHPAGPGGEPGVRTLIDPGSVRRAAWANTLALEFAAQRYAADVVADPWSSATRTARSRHEIGLVSGLYFQPRGIWLIPVGNGQCSFTGALGSLVRRSPMLFKSKITEKRPDDLWRHPCAPLGVNSQGIGVIRLNAERPAWTGLAQLLDPLSKEGEAHPSAGPALVLQQWKTLHASGKCPRLLILDFDRDKAKIKRRFFEAFLLTEQFLANPNIIDRLRALVVDAQMVEKCLVRTLASAGFVRADVAKTSFWTASEAPFLDWLARITAVDEWNDAAARDVDEARRSMEGALRRTARTVFDAHVAVSEFNLHKQARVAQARRRLVTTLYPTPAPSAAEVTT